MVLNRLYGILTNGDNTVRKTTGTRDGSTLVIQIVEALIPAGISDEGKRALAELYIRLCQASRDTAELLRRVDPINSYDLQSFYGNFSDTISINDIALNIQKIGLPDEENSFLPLDYIANALYNLLKALDERD